VSTGRGAVQWLFMRPGPLHHRACQPGTEHCGPKTRLFNLQDSGRRSWDSSQILQSKGVFLASTSEGREGVANLETN
jgi:hypothetical protein